MEKHCPPSNFFHLSRDMSYSAEGYWHGTLAGRCITLDEERVYFLIVFILVDDTPVETWSMGVFNVDLSLAVGINGNIEPSVVVCHLCEKCSSENITDFNSHVVRSRDLELGPILRTTASTVGISARELRLGVESAKGEWQQRHECGEGKREAHCISVCKEEAEEE
jgi:hypothetical protein